MADAVDQILSKYQTSGGASAPDHVDAILNKYSPPTPQHTVGENIQDSAEGIGNFATLGTIPALQAMAKGLIQDPNEALDIRLRSHGATIQQPDWHDIGRDYDSFRKLRDDTAKNNPEAYYGAPLGVALGAGLGAGIEGAGVAAPYVKGFLGHPLTKEALKAVGVPAGLIGLGKWFSSDSK